MIMEAEKMCSWQAGDLLAKQSYEVLRLKFQSESEDLRTRSANPRDQGKWLSQLKQSNVTLSPLFCSIQVLNRAVIPHELVR